MRESNEDKSFLKANPQTSWSPVVIIILILVIGGVAFLLSSPENPNIPASGDNTNSVAGSEREVPREWKRYINQQYNFRIAYPDEGWTIAEAPQHEVSPRFSIYKNDTVAADAEYPLDHFASGTYIGIYPRGIPTEGILGDTATSTIPLEITTRRTRAYLLDDGTPWGVYIQPKEFPQSWRSYGFLWGRAVVDNMNILCMRDGEEVRQTACEPLHGDRLIRKGTVDAQDWETIQTILGSFQFVEENTTQ